jgi:hypothetical protein
MSATVEPGATRQSVFRRQFDERILNGPLTDGSSMPTYCCTIGSHESRAAPKEGRMRKQREALLVAALAGLLIVGAAALVVQPVVGTSGSDVRLGQATVLQSPAEITRAG